MSETTKPGYNMLMITESLKKAGYSDIVDIATQTKNRNGETRRTFEIARIAMLENSPECVEDLDILMAWALGWTSILRKFLEERIAAHTASEKIRKKNRPKNVSSKTPIDFSKDPVQEIINGIH